MSGTINLRRARKQAARDARRRASAESGAAAGEDAATRAARVAEAERQARALEGHRRRTDDGAGGCGAGGGD